MHQSNIMVKFHWHHRIIQHFLFIFVQGNLVYVSREVGLNPIPTNLNILPINTISFIPNFVNKNPSLFSLDLD